MVLDSPRSTRLLSLNDPLLHALIEACDEASRRIALEKILVDVAAPTIRKAMAHVSRFEGGVQPADADDIASAVTLRLVRKLQFVAEREDEAIERLPDYIAKQTFNAIHDLLRSRFPERMRLKHQLRYVLSHDPRLALWTSESGLAAGLASFRNTEPLTEIALTNASSTRAMLERDRPADAIFAVLSRIDAAVLLEPLITRVAELWNVTDHAPSGLAALSIGDEQPSAHDRAVARQMIRILWSEVRELRAPQRAALLLNLRDAESANGMAEFLVANVATFDELAEAVGLSVERLAEIWSELPLDDFTIGGMLGLTRQQVINLRQAARDRLSRRISRKRRR